MNIRVVKADGTTPSLSAYLIRWLLYGIDVTITGGLGVLVILLTKNSQRLGDLAAGTYIDQYGMLHVLNRTDEAGLIIPNRYADRDLISGNTHDAHIGCDCRK